MLLSSAEEQALTDFCARVRARYGGRVSRLALFGSRARSDAHADSDIDVCVAIDDLTAAERRDVFGIAGDVLEEREVLLSAFVTSAEHLEHLRQRERALAEAIATEGIAL